jgi:hypothetical protein
MRYETQQPLLAVSQRGSTRLVRPSGMQCSQSLVRKFPAGTGYRVTVSEHGHAGAGTKRLLADCKWQPFRFVFCRGCQWNDSEHPGHEQPAVADHDYDRRNLSNWHGEREGQHSERDLGKSRLQQRWNQQRPGLNHYLGITALD